MLNAHVISLFLIRKCKKIQKIDTNSQYWRRKSSDPLNDLSNFNVFFRKDVTDNNIIWQKEQGFTLSLEDAILEKPQERERGGGGFTPLPVSFQPFKGTLSYDIKSHPLTIVRNILKQININQTEDQLLYQQNTCTLV